MFSKKEISTVAEISLLLNFLLALISLIWPSFSYLLEHTLVIKNKRQGLEQIQPLQYNGDGVVPQPVDHQGWQWAHRCQDVQGQASPGWRPWRLEQGRRTAFKLCGPDGGLSIQLPLAQPACKSFLLRWYVINTLLPPSYEHDNMITL